jgi:hypothetical protein
VFTVRLSEGSLGIIDINSFGEDYCFGVEGRWGSIGDVRKEHVSTSRPY